MTPFYVCWNPENRNPMVQHDTADEAEQEAARIALKERPGTAIHVLVLYSTCYVKADVTWEYPVDNDPK